MPIDTQLWLVTVAVGRYADPSLPPLPGVIQDANRLADVLRDRGAALAGAVPLFDAGATRDRILDALRSVAARAFESHQVVFWFGGHGCERPGGDSPLPDGMTRYLLPHDATPETAETAGISMGQLAAALSGLWAAEVVVVLDCCHAGGLAAVFGGQLGDLLHRHRSRHVLAAARPVQQALETDAGSPLTQSFCDALDGRTLTAVSGDGRVSAASAGQYAQEAVRAFARKFQHRQEAVAVAVGAPIYLTRLAPPPKPRKPPLSHPLRPALHFHGRTRLREELVTWARAGVTRDRVVSLVAMGGTGKTALAERVLADLGDQSPAGVFVWSFDVNPQTEAFLRTACEYFTGQVPESAGGLVERLQTALAGDDPHLFVLDGLERVQAEGTTGRLRGEVENHQMLLLLQWLAAGQSTCTRALVTSRFPLIDLHDWRHAGYREERLDDLDPVFGAAVLRGWGVKGDDATLDRLAGPLHYFALAVEVLGSYLGQLWDGDPSKAPTFDRDVEAAADPKAARLNRILEYYARKLPAAERDLLARLATFPRGVTTESLGFLVAAGGAVAGALAGAGEPRLLRLAEQLRGLGLVFRFETRAGPTFSAHPVLRDSFKGLLGDARPDQIHEAVRAPLAERLEAKPAVRPADPADLDRYEVLIEHTRLAGRVAEAATLFHDALGGYPHLGRALGQYTRGLRIVSGFSRDGTPAGLTDDLAPPARVKLVGAWGLFAKILGDLGTARRAFVLQQQLDREIGDVRRLARGPFNLAEIEVLAGRWPAAMARAEEARVAAEAAGDAGDRQQALGYLATTLFALGRTAEGLDHYREAAILEAQQQVYFQNRIREAEFKLASGDKAGARSQMERLRPLARRFADAVARLDAALGRCHLPESPAEARRHLEAARSYSSRSDNVEVKLRCHHLAAEIATAEGDFDQARREAAAGLATADDNGFGQYAVELRLALARVLLAANDAAEALRRAREAWERSSHPESRYAWGEADALHLCGAALARLGDVSAARDHLARAADRRRHLGHPGLRQTEAELTRLM